MSQCTSDQSYQHNALNMKQANKSKQPASKSVQIAMYVPVLRLFMTMNWNLGCEFLHVIQHVPDAIRPRTK